MVARSASHRTRLSVVIALLLAATAFTVQPAVAQAVGVTGFTLDSEQGDWVGSGQSLTFTPANASIAPWETYGGGVTLRVSNDDHWFSATIRPPTGQTLQPGTYMTARFADETKAALDVGGDGRGCNDTVGTVTILESTFASDGLPETFAATYVQYCGSIASGPALYGELRYASSFDFAAASATPSFVNLGHVGISTQESVQIHIANTGTIPLQLGDAAIGGASTYSVLADGCSETTLDIGGTCTIDVGLIPVADGTVEATLTLPDTTARGERSVLLRGEGWRFGSTVTLSVSSLRVVHGRTVKLTAHLKQFANTIEDDLTIFATPYGDGKRVIATGPVNASGDLQATFTMQKRTSFAASFAGDAAYEPDTSTARVVEVQPIARGALSRYHATTGKYRLYRYTSACPGSGSGCPTYTATLIPAHPGKYVYGTLQMNAGGRWRTELKFRMRLDRKGKATTRFVYPDRRVVGIPTRVRFQFAGDADHLDARSTWSYFKVTS